jgi:hypothetical protein
MVHRSAFAVALIVTYGAIFAATTAFGWTRTWRVVGVDSMSPSFADLRTLTGVPSTIGRGIDPLRENPGDPWGGRSIIPESGSR